MKPLADSFCIPERPALPLVKDIFNAPPSYWDQFNIEFAATIRKVQKPATLRMQQTILEAQASSVAELINEVRDEFLKHGESVFRVLARPPVGVLLELIYDNLEVMKI